MYEQEQTLLGFALNGLILWAAAVLRTNLLKLCPMSDAMITLLAKMTPKDLLVNHLEEALASYKMIPTDDNFNRLALCSTLVAMKSSADGEVVHELLEEMASNTIPFFMASAN